MVEAESVVASAEAVRLDAKNIRRQAPSFLFFNIQNVIMLFIFAFAIS